VPPATAAEWRIKMQNRSLPYPEEAADFNLKITREQLLTNFFSKYLVPEVHWDFWKSVTIQLDSTLPYPAAMVSETKTLMLKPEYANPGILAHEFSHLSYYLLAQRQKDWFAEDYQKALKTDDLLKLLDEKNSYMNTSIVEAHAEIFRYLGIQMPPSLKMYYPKLTY
jgi:hypothetical protein